MSPKDEGVLNDGEKKLTGELVLLVIGYPLKKG